MILKNREETGYRSDCLLKFDFDIVPLSKKYLNELETQLKKIFESKCRF